MYVGIIRCYITSKSIHVRDREDTGDIPCYINTGTYKVLGSFNNYKLKLY